ncbi:MAG: thioredoxin domain-containing protein, partial [Propionibacteriales bacterium]|nr:thioredoxin domain-containing protein [Propionibacteriales bacterium]
MSPSQPPAGSRRKKLAQQRAAAAARKRRNRIFTIVFTCAVIALAAIIAVPMIVDASRKSQQAPPTNLGVTVRENSHRLTSVPDNKVTFVEFLDFECEACGSVYPAIEELRKEYGDRVTFVVRYFPITSHFNSERAARAVEAAARQDKFEPMYKMMFENQTSWAEQRVPQDDVFRSYAQELGLDMAKWDKDYVAPETMARIRADQADGETLGVQGTPSFFLNGEKFE